MCVLNGVLLTCMLLIHGARPQAPTGPSPAGLPTVSVEPSDVSPAVPAVSPLTPLLPVAPPAISGGTSGVPGGSSGLTIVPPAGLPPVSGGTNLIPPSISITTGSSNTTTPNTGPSVSGTVGIGGPGSGISIILNTQDCAQEAVQCPAGYMMSFCTGCLAKCTKNIESFSFAAFKEHMKIITAPDGSNCTTNFFSVTRQGTCRLGSCVTPLFTRSSKLKLCPLGLLNC